MRDLGRDLLLLELGPLLILEDGPGLTVVVLRVDLLEVAPEASILKYFPLVAVNTSKAVPKLFLILLECIALCVRLQKRRRSSRRHYLARSSWTIQK